MAYQLLFKEPADTSKRSKDIFENILLDDLSSEYKVYVFYYAGAIPNQEFENDLHRLGNIAGNNLLINIGRLDDPNYYKITSMFKIERFPVIVVTANSSLASVKMGTIDSTAYVRIDDESLMSSIEKSIKVVETLFLLFLQGEVSRALKAVSEARHEVLLSKTSRTIKNILNATFEFLQERDISVSIFEGRLELKRNSGSTR